MGQTKNVYGIVLDWPKTNILTLGAVSQISQVTMLGYTGGPFKFAPHQGGGTDIMFPAIPENMMPCQWAWVLKFTMS